MTIISTHSIIRYMRLFDSLENESTKLSIYEYTTVLII